LKNFTTAEINSNLAYSNKKMFKKYSKLEAIIAWAQSILTEKQFIFYPVF
jgi:hypothetical protein